MHDGHRSCRVPQGVPAAQLEALFGPEGVPEGLVAEERCALLEFLVRGFQRRGPPAPDAAGAELAEAFLLVERIVASDPEREVDVAYLLRSARNQAIDAQRRETGAPRCGACRHYLHLETRGVAVCSRPGAPYPPGLAPGTHPRTLDPRCDFFSSKRVCASQGAPDVEDLEPTARKELRRIVLALDELRSLDRTAHTILFEHHVRGRSLRELERESGTDRRRLARLLARAEERLRNHYETLP